MSAASVSQHKTLEAFVPNDAPDAPISIPNQLTVPYAVRAKAPETNQSLTINGTIKPDAGRFEINLLNGVSYASQLEHPMATIPRQIPLHCCFHFEVGISVMNSYMDGDWGYEECHLNPFTAGTVFEVKIVVEKEGYVVFGNGKRIASFQHRIDPRAVDYVQIRGDIELEGVVWSEPEMLTAP